MARLAGTKLSGEKGAEQMGLAPVEAWTGADPSPQPKKALVSPASALPRAGLRLFCPSLTSWATDCARLEAVNPASLGSTEAVDIGGGLRAED
jgi:hypothetical protein